MTKTTLLKLKELLTELQNEIRSFKNKLLSKVLGVNKKLTLWLEKRIESKKATNPQEVVKQIFDTHKKSVEAVQEEREKRLIEDGYCSVQLENNPLENNPPISTFEELKQRSEQYLQNCK